MQSDVGLKDGPGLFVGARQQQIGAARQFQLLLQCGQGNERVERRDLAGLKTEPAKLRVRRYAGDFESQRHGGILLRRNGRFAGKLAWFGDAQHDAIACGRFELPGERLVEDHFVGGRRFERRQFFAQPPETVIDAKHLRAIGAGRVVRPARSRR